MRIDRDKVLIKRAVGFNGGRGVCIYPADIDFDRSAVEGFDSNEYVVIRSNSDILSVFLVEGWQVKLLEHEEWPDELLDEAESAEK